MPPRTAQGDVIVALLRRIEQLEGRAERLERAPFLIPGKAPLVVPWTSFTLINGWTHYPGYGPAQYCKDALGFVHFRGLIQPASATASSFAVLPTGLAPDAVNALLDVMAYGPDQAATQHHSVRIDISTTGGCSVTEYTGQSWISLNGAYFFAELE